jgi:hypothetical protein
MKFADEKIFFDLVGFRTDGIQVIQVPKNSNIEITFIFCLLIC